MKRRWSRLPAPLAALLVVVLTACSGGSARNTLPAGVSAINVGYSYTGSGPTAAACNGQRAGYELWAATVNKAGGIALGKRRLPVQLTGYDDGGNAAQAAQNAERLVLHDGVDVLLGPCDAAESAAVATVTAHYQRLLVVTAPFADSTLARAYRTVVTVAPTAVQYPLAATALLARQSPPPRLAVLWADDQPSKAIGQAAVTASLKAGLTVDTIGAYPTGAADFSAQATRIASAGDAALLIAGRPAEAAALRSALTAAGVSPRFFILAAGEGWEALPTALGAAGEGVFALTPWPGALATPADPLFGSPASYAAAFAAQNGYPPTALAALATAGGEVLDAAISSTDAVDGAALRAWFNHGGTTATVAGTVRVAVDAGNSSLLQIVGGRLVPVSGPPPSPTTTPGPTPFITPIAAPARGSTPGG
jgi:branched-chain amino acid transport system substrate-binding protein